MRYTVLTYIFGDYEHVHEVREKDPDADYILVTDNPSLTSKTWRVVYDKNMSGLSIWERCYQVRFYPFSYTGNNIVVRVDGSIGINRPLSPVIERFVRGKYHRCLMIHPYRDTIPDEYDAWVAERGYPRQQANYCVSVMKSLGYDMSRRGLFQGCFEIIRHNRLNTIINNMTYSLLRYLAPDNHIERVNQTVLTFVVNHLFSERVRIMPVSERILHGELMTWYHHNSNEPIPFREPIAPVMFNKPARTLL